MAPIMAPHGGYKSLKSYQTTEIIYDLTVNFCRRYILDFKLKGQMEGAARGGSLNLAEASKNSGASKQTEIRLTEVARGSQEELQCDLTAYLRQHNLPVWHKNDSRTLKIRQLAYAPNRTYKTYESYMSNPESAANCLLCLCNQAAYLIDQQLQSLDRDLAQHGDYKERYREERKKQIVNLGPSLDEFLKGFGLERLENGQVIKVEEDEKQQEK